MREATRPPSRTDVWFNRISSSVCLIGLSLDEFPGLVVELIELSSCDLLVCLFERCPQTFDLLPRQLDVVTYRFALPRIVRRPLCNIVNELWSDTGEFTPVILSLCLFERLSKSGRSVIFRHQPKRLPNDLTGA